MSADLVLDAAGGLTLLLDGLPQSHVDPGHPGDPAYLVFEYVRLFACVLDGLPPGPLRVTHVGGGAMTLARYVQSTRPGSPQIVLEPDAALTALVRERLPLSRGHRIRVRPVDGRAGVVALRDVSADVLVLDAYAAGRVPPELTTTAFFTDAARVVGDGLVLANITDERDRSYVSRVVAGLQACFADVLVAAPAEVLKGRRFGNSVLVASQQPLDVAGLRRQVARLPFPAGVSHGPELRAGKRPWTDEDSSASPQPPPLDGTWRAR